jgi:phospho-N-acetylmuramoyl-pentapeptide-transferase
MALGGALAGFAIVFKTELLLLLIGGVYLLEALSVIIQVFTFKYLGRRVFLMAPFHYHFEMGGWAETAVVIRFWIGVAMTTALALGIFYYVLEVMNPRP